MKRTEPSSERRSATTGDASTGGQSAASDSLQDCFARGEVVQINQKPEALEVMAGFETCNHYDIDFGTAGSGKVAQEFAGVVKRVIMGHRPAMLGVYGPGSQLMLRLHRPTYAFFSKMIVTSGDDRPVGIIQRKWSWVLSRVYDLVDVDGQVFATVRSPCWRIWTFTIYDSRTRRSIGEIKKLWGGLAKEALTDADSFTVDLQSAQNLSHQQRAIAFAAALAIDFDLFEKRKK